jgi:crotonobetainyl-CoA:carnitine CoA-transferase CaiB-like acyl-CoA transferase
MGPLTGLKILDLSRVLAGPWCGQILADLGAEVIKVERPGAGDDTRHWGPPFLHDAAGQPTDIAAYYLAANRGKQSIAVDMTTAEGQQIICKLACNSDVLLENFKRGDLARYGLDYPALHVLNPGLIYCSVTGFGQTGPNADRPGYDYIIQAMAGLMSVTGTPETGPLKVGVAVADLTTGMYAAIGVLAALQHVRSTGEGQHIDMALFDVQLSWLANQNMNYLAAGTTPGLLGNGHPSIVPYQDFATSDRRLIIAVGNDKQFAQLCAVLEHPQWASDSRFAKNAARVVHRDLLVPMIDDLTRQKSSAHWQAALDGCGIPCGPINTIAEAFASDQAQARDLRVRLPHTSAGHVDTVANPIKFSATSIEYGAAPPALGAQTMAVLKSLGYNESEITALAEKSIVSC